MRTINILISFAIVLTFYSAPSLLAEPRKQSAADVAIPDIPVDVYKHASGHGLQIYRFEPAGHEPLTEQRPAAVFFFGGGWNGGSVRQFEKHAKYLASRGMVTFLADYRVKKKHGTDPDACVQDGKSAIRWVRANASQLGIDPNKIAAGGGSAGGHVAAATGICNGFEDPTDNNNEISSKPNALLLFNPVYDNGPEGYGYSRVIEHFPAISPAHNITSDDPPTLVFLGSKDKLVPVSTAQKFDADLKRVGVRSALHVYSGQPHGFFNESKSPRCFVDTILKMDHFLTSLGWLRGPPKRTVLCELLEEKPSRPNVVLIMCDDLGYGDVHCLNPHQGKIKTPHIDALAAAGMTFTDAHSGSAVCTPTRYGLLTGRHCWRTKLQNGVVQGFSPCLIADGRPTVASFLKTKGYKTALIGKWHLNYQYQDPETGAFLNRKNHSLPPVGAEIPDGPLAHGFDFFHGFHHSRDMDAIVEDTHVIEHDDAITMLPRLADQSIRYIEKAAKNKTPFFLYIPLSSPHTPIVPSEEWLGKSGISDYADFVMQTDDVVGQIIQAVDTNGLAEKTIIIFTSDNGCSKAANIDELKQKGHHVSGIYRGSKADLWEGGHRVPFLVRWTNTVKQKSYSNQTICLTDFFATLTDLLLNDIPPLAAEDSVSFLPALYGQAIVTERKGIIHSSISGHFGYRMNEWKLLLARGSGGWTSPKEGAAKQQQLPAYQLYNMTTDPTESNNVGSEHRDIAHELYTRLRTDIDAGRSTIGTASANDTTAIKLWKSGPPTPEL